MILLATDIGGTFTDLIAFDTQSGKIQHAKSLTTPDDPVIGVIDCIRKADLAVSDISQLIHGSTIAINTVIESKGAKVGLMVTRGTRDVYSIGRSNRPEAYNLFFRRPRPLVRRRHTFEVDERLYASGEVRVPLNRESIKAAVAALREQGAEAVAICFLHSYANPEHEQTVGKIVQDGLPGVFLSISHEILRAYREYERISTTVVNAYIGPKVGGYVRNLQSRLRSIGFNGELAIMQSNGGVMTPEVAVKRPVMMMESGPVGGIIASAEVGKPLGERYIAAFDMGGTTAKASLVLDGEPATAEGYYVGGYASGHPVMAPVVDVVEVGAGGGSIAWVDEVGALKVGPRSAGAEPGPIAYRRGGTQPTITDANVVLGRIGVSDFLGGEMQLDRDAAVAGLLERIAKPLELDVFDAARAVIAIAVSKMSLAVREVLDKKGHDPRDFTLVASGGAGPPHAIAVARDLHIPKVIIPIFPSHFSALGMIMTDERHDLVRTFYVDLDDADFSVLRNIFSEMRAEGDGHLENRKDVVYRYFFDIRYVGQEFTLTVPLAHEDLENSNRSTIRAAFDSLHEKRYAHHAPKEHAEILNLRLMVLGRRAKLALSPLPDGKSVKERERRRVFFESSSPVDTPVYDRNTLPAGVKIIGPALINEYGSTTVIFPGDELTVARTGELIITLEGA